MTDVRPARDDDLGSLPEIERAADGIFATIGIVGLPPVASTKEFAAAAAVLVAGDPPVGFARLELKVGEAYLDQLSVHPSVMRHGIGAALLEAAVGWAREQDYDSIFLATFRDVAWNAPFYARHGFVETPATTPGMRDVEAQERVLRMERVGPRILMRRTC
ncbi:MAG TPA: GNAT family N-acetyltransferase [Mycobacteriales bacterium]|jgi:GNAT superfamily N-acetyltransferase|nr:GNAT family N-acetyltransferase [Mycobacteriales bacterium]